MAKGFTVKAKAPQPSETAPEWDYDLARSMIKGKSIVFCLPGRGVSYTYLKSFVQLCFDIVQNGGNIQISQDYSSMILNDWSARDIQAWEYQPLGPFQAKATATSISPWIVMKEAHLSITFGNT